MPPRRRGPDELPLASDIDEIVGTPHYLAPEMAAGDGAMLDARSDVYLLGACLHEVLCGDAPHDGPDLRTVLTAAFRSKPQRYAERWPSDLVAICRRAMHRDREERFADAAAFAEAVDQFLLHRDSLALSEDAQARFDQLRQAIDGKHGDAEIYDAFGACRFGFGQALRAWEGNAAARDGLRRCLVRMIEFELSRGSPRAAAAYLAELPDPDEDLAERVATADQQIQNEAERLERIERDNDPTVGDRLRAVVAFVTAPAWGLAHFVCGWINRSGEPITHHTLAWLSAAFLGAAAVTAWLGRSVFFATSANARTSWAFLFGFGLYVIGWLSAGQMAAGIAVTFVFLMLSQSLWWAVLALSSDRRVFPLPLALMCGAVATLLRPENAFEWQGFATFGGAMGVALNWWYSYHDRS